MSNVLFKNKILKKKGRISVIHESDQLVQNFGKQWKTYRDVQIDSINNFNISLHFLKELLFDELTNNKNKNVLEIGCGAGRFTEYLSRYFNSVTSVDLSDAVFYNISKNEKNVSLYKADFLKLIPIKKYDVVFCRGVLQHTKNPKLSIIKLYDFVKDDGFVFFDIYKLPKLGLIHPKYSFWRPVIKRFIKYKTFENFLLNNIRFLLKIKRFIDFFFLNKKFFSDCIIPIWDYKNILQIENSKLEKFSILDTLDGIYAHYDQPMKYQDVMLFLERNKIKVEKTNSKKNIFKTSKL